MRFPDWLNRNTRSPLGVRWALPRPLLVGSDVAHTWSPVAASRQVRLPSMRTAEQWLSSRNSGVEIVVVGLFDVAHSSEAAGLAGSSFSIFEPRLQAPRHRSMSLWRTGEATICASSNVALNGTCQKTLPVGGSSDAIVSAVQTISCRQPPAVMTTGAL